MVKTEYLTAPPPLTQAEIDEIECRERKHPLGSEAEEIRLLQDKIQYLLASPEEARRIEKEWQAEIARLEAYVDWLQAESRAAREVVLDAKQWILEHHGPEHLARLEREFELQGSIERGNHKKTASVTIVMSPTLRSSLEKISQRHRVTIAAWARDVLHHAALEYYPESSE